MFSSVEKNTGFRERDGIRSLLVPCVGAWLVAAAAALLLLVADFCAGRDITVPVAAFAASCAVFGAR